MADIIKSFDAYLKSRVDWENDDNYIETELNYFEKLKPGVMIGNILPKSGGPWVRGIMLQCSEEMIADIKEHFHASKTNLVEWSEPRSSALIVSEATTKQTDQNRTKVGAWANNPDTILAKLNAPTTNEKEFLAAILLAEKQAFEAKNRELLLAVLGNFIENNRLTEDADRMVYLCSAIRKYAMNMGQDNFEAFCKWLLPTETTPVHHEVEMEFVKALSYRLQFEKLELAQEFPAALSTLNELASGYLRKSLILQKSYANTAMLSVICIAILESLLASPATLTPELLKIVNSLGIIWFQEMVEDNLEDATSFVKDNNPEVAQRLRSILSDN